MCERTLVRGVKLSPPGVFLAAGGRVHWVVPLVTLAPGDFKLSQCMVALLLGCSPQDEIQNSKRGY